MTHDPLCRSRNVDGFPCYTCALIARVREDERANVLRDTPPSVFVKAFTDGRSSGYDVGYTAALRDARNEAAIALTAIDTYLPPDEHNAVLAAIEALGDKR